MACRRARIETTLPNTAVNQLEGFLQRLRESDFLPPYIVRLEYYHVTGFVVIELSDEHLMEGRN